jgi:hypothetical protein
MARKNINFEKNHPLGPALLLLVRVLILAIFMSSTLTAQKGSAPPGFYPGNYNGDTFTGTVIQTGSDFLTLKYQTGAKEEVFSGTIEKACMAQTKHDPRTIKELHLTAIPKGSVLTVFYNTARSKNANGSKNEKIILALRFDEVNGEKLTNPNRPVIMCSEAKGGLAVH